MYINTNTKEQNKLITLRTIAGGRFGQEKESLSIPYEQFICSTLNYVSSVWSSTIKSKPNKASHHTQQSIHNNHLLPSNQIQQLNNKTDSPYTIQLQHTRHLILCNGVRPLLPKPFYNQPRASHFSILFWQIPQPLENITKKTNTQWYEPISIKELAFQFNHPPTRHKLIMNHTLKRNTSYIFSSTLWTLSASKLQET